MARLKPKIDIGSITTKRDRESFQAFVLEVIKDTFIYEVTPTTILLDVETNTLFTLNLDGFRFVYEDLIIADSKDYLDVYLYGVKQPSDRYLVIFDTTSITITFTENITRIPTDVEKTDFEIKGKITQIV
jgi:hypothetical protein